LQTEGLDEGIASVISAGLEDFQSLNTESISTATTETALTDSDSLAQLQSSFNAYIESIRIALAELSQPAPEEVTENTEIPAPEETTTEDTILPATTEEATVIPEWQLAVEQFIAELTLSFETAMSELNAELENVSVLPELSEPTGQGRAYDKFLAVYNEMQSSGTNTSESNLIDATA
jgi:hypothetical protein